MKSLQDSGLLLKEVSEAIQNEVKEQKGGFLSMLLGTIVASLLGNMLTGKGINRAGEEIIRAGYVSKISSIKDLQFNKMFLIPPHPFANLEIQKCYQNEPRFNGVYSRDNLPDKIKEGAYAVNYIGYSDLIGLLFMH